jgi:hypothetical protein
MKILRWLLGRRKTNTYVACAVVGRGQKLSMTEFPSNPSDVSSQMEPSLVDRLNDAKVWPGIERLGHGHTAKLMVPLSYPSSTVAPVDLKTDIFSMDRFGEIAGQVDDPFPFVEVRPDEFGINNIEVTASMERGVNTWNIVASGSAGKVSWNNLGEWGDGEWIEL